MTNVITTRIWRAMHGIDVGLTVARESDCVMRIPTG